MAWAKSHLKQYDIPSMNLLNSNDCDSHQTIESAPEVMIYSLCCQNYSRSHRDEILL